MHYRIDPLGVEYRIQGDCIPNVTFDQLAPSHEFPMAEQKVIEHDTLMPRGDERLGTVASDVAGTAGDQNACH